MVFEPLVSMAIKFVTLHASSISPLDLAKAYYKKPCAENY